MPGKWAKAPLNHLEYITVLLVDEGPKKVSGTNKKLTMMS
jgi:hypothetical protein